MAAIDEQRMREIVREELSKLLPKVMAEMAQKLPVMMARLKTRSM
jgi:hypothetical protein